MAEEKVSELPIEAIGFGDFDWMLISKEIAPLVYESEKIDPNNLFYDSGFKNIPYFNGVYGVADINTLGLTLHPSIRIINRTVFVSGLLILPLSQTVDGLTLANNYANYDNAPNKDVPYLYEGINGGFSEANNGTCSTVNPILPTILAPENTSYLSVDTLPTRNIKLSVGNKRYPLQSHLQGVYMTADGRLGFSPPVAVEGNGNKNFSVTSPLSELCSIFDLGDFMPDYANYGSGFTGATNNRNIITPSTETSPLTIDAREGLNLGGFYLIFNSSYQIDVNTPMNLIISAFDAL